MGTPFDDLRKSDLGPILSSCEPELQELMRQVDIMIDTQRKKWQEGMLALEVRLRSVEEELCASRELNQRKDLEIKLLRQQSEDVDSGHLELVQKYEQQLHEVRTELDDLKKSYQKLQHKQTKYAAKGAHSREISQLQQKTEEYQQLCTKYKNQQKTMEAQIKSLMEELEQVNLQFETYQKETERSPLDSCSELQCLETQLESAQNHLRYQELELERLRHCEGTEEQLAALRTDNQRLREHLQRYEQKSSPRRYPSMSTQTLLDPDGQPPSEGHRATDVSKRRNEDIHRMLRTESMEETCGQKVQGSSRPLGQQYSEENSALARRILQLGTTLRSGSDGPPEGAVGGKISTSPQRAVSPGNLTVARFLEQEIPHERELLQKIDGYIQALRESPTCKASEHQPGDGN